MNIGLRQIEKDDLEIIRAWRNSTEVSSYMYSSEYITESAQIQWYNRIHKDQTCKYWVITYGGKALGVASLTDISTRFSSCYWAFYLGDSSIRGAGIGSKVEYSVITYVFDDLGLNKLRCEVLETNAKVISMHEKFGFRREAFYRQHIKKDGIVHNVVGLALLKSEWASVKESMKKKIYRNA